MKRIVEFNVNAEHYTVDACFIWCFDRRFECLVTGVMEYYGFKTIDPVNVAGGVKDIVKGGVFSRNYLLKQIGAAIKFHGAKNVVLMAHVNCAAYGKHFKTDEDALAYYKSQLDRGAQIVEDWMWSEGVKNVRIIKIYADFKGAIEV